MTLFCTNEQQSLDERTVRRMSLALRLFQETPSFKSTQDKQHRIRAEGIFHDFESKSMTQRQYKYLMSYYSEELKFLDHNENRLVSFLNSTSRYINSERICIEAGDIGLVIGHEFIKRYVTKLTLELEIMLGNSVVIANVPCRTVVLLNGKSIIKSHAI